MTKALTSAQIAHLATLSSLTLTDQEQGAIADQFSQTIDYVENLNELDLQGVDAAYHLSGKHDVFFEDGMANTRSVDVEELGTVETHGSNHYFIVKKIL